MKIHQIKEKLIACGAVLALIMVMYLLDLPCPVARFLLIDCPGCGITRAYICLFHLDIKGAFAFHPLFWTIPIILLLYLLDGKLFRKQWMNTLLIALLCLSFFANWIWKLLR